MATGLENYPNINPLSVDYPFGDLKDKTSGSAGTPINRLTNADIHQTFAKILDEAGLVANGLPENVTNGYQYILALNDKIKKLGITQGGTTGQFWGKNSNTNYDGDWKTIQQFPSGGLSGMVWSKDSNSDYVGSWKNEFVNLALTSVNGTAFAWISVTRGGVVTITGRINGLDFSISGSNIFDSLLPAPYGNGVDPITIIADKEGIGITFLKLYPDGRISPSSGEGGVHNVNFTFSYLSL